MPRHGAALRLLGLWRALALAREPLSAAALADAVGRSASPRTIRRDLEVLESLNVRIDRTGRGRDVRYSTFHDGPPLQLDGDALLVLRLALNQLGPIFDKTALGASLAFVVQHLEAQVSPRALAFFSTLTDGLVVRPGAGPRYADSAEVIRVLGDAITRGKMLAFDYQGLGGAPKARRLVHPQRFVWAPRGLYLYAEDPGRGVRSFRVERIRNAAVDARPAQRSKVDAEDYLSGSIGIFSPEHPPRRFRVRVFTDAAAQLLRENPWHSSQKIERDGRAWLVTLELRSSRELVPRVLALGDAGEPVAPAEFRAEVGRQARVLAGRCGAMGHRGETVSRSSRDRDT